jgi:dTDP-glucose 4,6-dehydratase
MMNKTILVTGCAGFIGSHVAEEFLANGYNVVGYDAFTYAGKVSNLEKIRNNPKFLLQIASINDEDRLIDVALDNKCGWIVNLAAETHVDNSIRSCDEFLNTNVLGTKSVLNACKATGMKLLHFSTDEVYGVPAEGESFTEDSPLKPRNPYSASKAAADHLIAAYANTYGLKYVIVRPSNNFGPRQHEEKFLPKMIRNLLSAKKIPVYGDGSQVREWTYVKSTAAATRFIVENAPLNNIYNITSGKFMKNIDVVNRVCEMVQLHAPDFIDYVPDRLGHDVRYSIDCTKLNRLGFSIDEDFDAMLWNTIQEFR